MRKLLSISLIVVMLTLLAVSCRPESKALDDGLALVSFSTEQVGTRSLEKTDPSFDQESYIWYYTARKADETGLITGQTVDGESNAETVKNAVNTKGIENTTVGPFSYGDWIFTLYAYDTKDSNGSTVVDKDKLVFEGSSKVTIKDKTTSIKVTVSAKMTGKDGYLELPKKGSITITQGSIDTINPKYNKLVEKISILSLDTTDAEAKDYYNISEADTSNGIAVDNSGNRTFTLKSGSYAVTVTYLEGATTTDEGKTYTGGYSVADETIYVTVYDYLTTKISGNIVEYNGSATFDVIAEGVFTSAKVESVSKTTDGKNVAKTIAVKSSPETKAVDDTDTSTEKGEQKTTVTIEEGAISGFEDDKGSATLIVTAYDQTAAASTIPTFSIEVDDADKTVTTIGALDIELLVKKSSTDTGTKVKTFEEGKKLTITTYIKPGLDKTKIHVPYSGDGADGEVTDYDSTTGLLTFTVSHLSQYYIAVEEVAVYVPANGDKGVRTFGTFEEAVEGSVDGDTLVLWKDVTVNKKLDVKKSLTIDLNRRTLIIDGAVPFITFGDDDSSSNSPAFDVAIKNGTLRTDRTDSGNLTGSPFIFTVSEICTLTLDNVVVRDTTYNGVVFNCMPILNSSSLTGSETIKLVVKNSEIYSEGEQSRAVYIQNYTNAKVGVEVTDSTVEASGEGSAAVKALGGPNKEVKIEKSTIKGTENGVWIQVGGSANISNSTVEAGGIGDKTYALVVLNSEVTLDNVKLVADNGVALAAGYEGEVTGSITEDSAISVELDDSEKVILKKGDTTYVAGDLESLPEGKFELLDGKTTIEIGTIPTCAATDKVPAGTEVKWRILEVDNDQSKVLVLSENVLPLPDGITHTQVVDSYESAVNYSWSNSGIKAWLNSSENGKFKNLYGLEDVKIAKVTLETETYGDYTGKKDSTENEEIFLLTWSDVAIAGDAVRVDGTFEFLGGDYLPNYKGKYFADGEDRLAYDLNDSLAQWWLRSPQMTKIDGWPDLEKQANFIQVYGNKNCISAYTYAYQNKFDGNDIGIRPAFWLDLSK